MDNLKIFLNGQRSKDSTNKPFYQPVNLKANKKTYTEENVNGVVSAFDIYHSERKKSNKVRLTCNINPVCSNVLFNPITEIVKGEGGSDPFLLNYETVKNGDIWSKDGIYNPIKPITTDETTAFNGEINSGFTWNQYEAIRDTQLSSNNFGFKYHCGIDIFNNHLLRSNTFKIVSYNETNSYTKKSDGRRMVDSAQTQSEHVYIDQYFNTIDDWMRDSRGNIVYNNFFNPYSNAKTILYTAEVSNFNGENKVENNILDSDFYATFDLTLKFKDPLNLMDLKKNTTISIEVKYEVTEYKTKKNYPRVFSDVQTIQSPNTEKIFTYKINSSTIPNDPAYIDKHLIGYKIKSVNVVINGQLSDKGNLSNKYFKEVKEKYIFDDGYWTHQPSPGGTVIEEYDLEMMSNGIIAADTFSNVCHLYQSYDVNTFGETIKKKLIEENGWFGFKNTSKLPTYDTETMLVSHPEKILDISKPINSKDASSFIDMYPGRDLYSFSPKYNKHKKRLEPNWDYCLTYPSSSETNGFGFIEPSNGALKIQMFDEFTVGDNGINLITFYSITQHGLKNGDKVNVYATFNGETNLVIGNATVSNVYDKYIFQINKNTIQLSNKWYDVSKKPKSFTADGVKYMMDSLHSNIYHDEGENPNNFYVVNETMRLNLDLKVNKLSFKRVVSNVECNYYVRIFSKLPNFKFSDSEISDDSLYGDNTKDLINRYSDSKHQFESHVNQIGFSKNIYGDEISEIVFTDDIDLSHLKDNLGRPLSDIYLTIVKRNKGYKEWYGVNGTNINLKSDNIEYSHCFGKNSCGFRLSDDSLGYLGVNDIRTIDSDREGLNIKRINVTSSLSADEIDFEECRNFYGDLCCYSPVDVLEESIQPILNRFNTAQRDLNINDKSYETFSSFMVDDIVNDETVVGFGDPYEIQQEGRHSEQTRYNTLPRSEGYYYKSHYKIPVKTVSSSLTERNGVSHTLLSITKTVDGFIIYTDNDNGFTLNEKPVLYDKLKNTIFICLITKLFTNKKFLCQILDESGNKIELEDIEDISRYNLVNRDETIPFYAKLIKDGSCRFYWREILQNGFDTNANVEIYPFTNNALYINRNVNFYLRRQNPSKKVDNLHNLSLNNTYITYEDSGELLDSIIEREDNYVSEKNIKEC